MIDALAGLLLLASVGPVEAADLIWSVDLESDDAGFSAAGETGQWEWDQVTTGPVSCFTGTTCWATLPQGAYLHEATDYLVFPSLDLTGTSVDVVQVLCTQGGTAVMYLLWRLRRRLELLLEQYRVVKCRLR